MISMRPQKVSYCIGIYNEEEILLQSLEVLKSNLDTILGKHNFEIILVENGSTDKTCNILKGLQNKHIKVLYLKKKGHGAALRMALENASYDYCLLTAIDIPFGFNDLKQMLPLSSRYDLIFGSKAHPDSKIKTDLKRKLASYIFRFLLWAFFRLPIRDPQGSIFINRSSILPILKYCQSDNAFFTTQLAIYSKLFGLRLAEIPVTLAANIRKSKYSVLRDGSDLFLTLLEEYRKYRVVKNGIIN